MAQKSKGKYLTKSVKFGTKTVTLYSIDGTTWSSRAEELEAIQMRHEQERVTFAQIKGEARPEAAEEETAEAEEAQPARRTSDEPTELIASDEELGDDDEEMEDEADEAEEAPPQSKPAAREFPSFSLRPRG